MPEGPEIRRAADLLIKAIRLKPLTNVWFSFPQLKRYQAALTGEKIIDIETRGKALLTHFSNGLSMYSHNQLYGIWQVVDTGQRPETKRDLRVALESKDKGILLYSASDIDIAERDHIERHPFLLRVGPDILDKRLDAAAVLMRLQDKRFCRRQLAGLLLDQAFLAGLGNYLRAEILWQAGILPTHKPADLTQQQLILLADALLEVPRLSYTTRGKAVHKGHQSQTLFKFHVFGREGEPCERCGNVIVRTMMANRPFFYCQNCQY
jgi:endonuclease-8